MGDLRYAVTRNYAGMGTAVALSRIHNLYRGDAGALGSYGQRTTQPPTVIIDGINADSYLQGTGGYRWPPLL